MFRVKKHFDICAAHQLDLPYDSPCNTMHGHNYQVSVEVAGHVLNQLGMLVDFTVLKKQIHGQLDHKTINDVIPDMHPTAENLAEWIASQVCHVIPKNVCVAQVVLKETDGNEVAFTPLGYFGQLEHYDDE